MKDERGARLLVMRDRGILVLGRRGRAAQRLEHPAKQKADPEERHAREQQDEQRDIEHARVGRVGCVQVPRFLGG